MNNDINVDILEKCVKFKEKQNISSENFISKIVEKTFLIENEIEICEKINHTFFLSRYYGYNGNIYYNLIYESKNIKLCEANKKILKKIELNDNSKEYVVLKFRKFNSNYYNFLYSLFSNIDINDNNEYDEYDGVCGHLFFCNDLINMYSNFIENFNFLTLNNFFYIDFSYENMNVDKKKGIIPILSNFQKCLYINNDEFGNNNYDNPLIIKKIFFFKKIVNNMNYFGNKHMLLFIVNYLIKNNCNYNDLINKKFEIIKSYMDNLRFLKLFSQKIKEDYKNKLEKNFTYYLEKFKDNTLSFCDNFIMYILLNKDYLVEIELFKFNSLFLNIVIQMIKIFNLKDSPYKISSKFMTYLLKQMIYCANENLYNDMLKNFSNYKDFLIECNKNKDYNNINYKLKEFINVKQKNLLELFIEVKENIDCY